MATKGNASIDDAKNVTKKHLVDQITRRTGLQRHEVQSVVQGVLDGLIEAIGEGKRVEIRDFGVFEVKPRAARTAQNPKTLEPVHVLPKMAVRFKPGRLMKEALQANAQVGASDQLHKVAPRTPVDPTSNGRDGAGRDGAEKDPPMVEIPMSDRMHAGAVRR